MNAFVVASSACRVPWGRKRPNPAAPPVGRVYFSAPRPWPRRERSTSIRRRLEVRRAGNPRNDPVEEQQVRHSGRAGTPLIELMRVLLLPHRIYSERRSSRTALPRLLDVVVSGFDQHLREHYPHFRPPGTLLLPISVRIPVLAGVSMMATRPDYWAERLIGSAVVDIRDRLISCLRSPFAAKRSTHLR
jgi:hypothetical protein